ncbi:DUF3016 domain-containing protein [Shewanella submarina]|uniref:DUF3016 domain-containing protein n=1 Tax=Shewanella submarina TaxID=2016376 RepID=A0ABV7G9N5_9GAMM|nr:DUF3016 domain-containing protein [Shewanella submarina]MCL1037181.1 DUF3016 domain-containing protein [Shewanella submarina]
MKYRYVLSSLVLAAAVGGCTSTSDNGKDAPVENFLTRDGNVYIVWKDPAKYSDIESTVWLQSKFEKYLFTELTDELGQEANEHLGKDMQLDLMVTNVDLAGDVQPTFGAGPDDVRVVSDLYPPRIAFDYVLKQNGRVVKQGSENINDMSFLFGIQPITSDPFPYERRILTKWFKETIEPALAKK